MSTLYLKQIIHDNTLPEAGDVLYHNMISCIPNNEKIVIDMTGVDSLPSLFLNTSIGRYLREYGANSLQGKMSFVGITVTQISRLKEYIARVTESIGV